MIGFFKFMEAYKSGFARLFKFWCTNPKDRGNHKMAALSNMLTQCSRLTGNLH